MKPSDFKKKAFTRLETLETEKIKKIHEIWKLESQIQDLKNSLDAIGALAISEVLNKNAEEQDRDFEELMKFIEKCYGRDPRKINKDDRGRSN